MQSTGIARTQTTSLIIRDVGTSNSTNKLKHGLAWELPHPLSNCKSHSIHFKVLLLVFTFKSYRRSTKDYLPLKVITCAFPIVQCSLQHMFLEHLDAWNHKWAFSINSLEYYGGRRMVHNWVHTHTHMLFGHYRTSTSLLGKKYINSQKNSTV